MKTKKLFLLLATSAVAAFSSCTKDNLQENSLPELSPLTVSASSEPGVKAAFSSENYPSVVWTGTEYISVLGATTGNQTFSTTDSGSSAEFSGLASLSDNDLYAVYPSDEAVTLNSGEIVTLANVTVPAVQTATAGSFDPKAFVCVASTTSEKLNFSFKPLVSLLKFRLDDAANVEKVVLLGNNNENMACTASAVTLEGSHAGTFTNVSSSVTVNGPFQSDCDYFAVTRPQVFADGITIFVQYTDGTVKSCKAKGPLFDSGETRGYICSLGTIPSDKLKEVTDRYALYNAGFDITVGSATFNAAMENAPAASTLEATTADVDIKSTINGTKKNIIVFLSSENDYKFTLAATANLVERVILVNRYSDKTVSVDASEGGRVLAKTGSLYMKDIDLSVATSSSITYFIYNYNITTDVDALVFDGCKISNIDMNFLAFTGTGIIKNIEIVNSDLKFNASASSTVGAAVIRSNQSVTYPKVVFNENILYCADNVARQVAMFSNSNTTLNASIASLTFTRNTVVGLYPTQKFSYFMVNALTSYTSGNNYYHLPKYIDTQFAGEKYLAIVNATTNPTDNSITRDYLWYEKADDAAAAKILKAFKTDLENDKEVYYPYMNYASDKNVLSIDWDAETFVSSNKNYGATR